MNYQHTFHAGNFADVFKHIILVQLIQDLSIKEKPFCYMDTHAGSGIYDLQSLSSQKTQESFMGIEKVIQAATTETPRIVKQYIETVIKLGYPNFYPGSPAIAEALLRPHDRLILSELKEEVFKTLRSYFKTDNRAALHHQDGFKGPKAFLPPKERRGIILIDPPYEREDDWNNILNSLKEGIQKFSTGIYAIWYPIKDTHKIKLFLESLQSLEIANVLNIEFCIYPSTASQKLIGCGMIIVNPPWQFKEELEGWLPWLWQILSTQKAGYYQIQNLSFTE